MTDNFGDFFDDAAKGGGGSPGFKFEKIGQGVKGTVTDIFRTKVTKMNSTEPKLDKNGKEIPQLNVTLQTELRDWKGVIKVPLDEDDKPLPASEDTGLRRVFLKYQASRAVADAIKAADAVSSDFKVGSELALKYVSDQPMKEGAMKIFEARFKKGEATADDFFESSDAASTSTEASAPATADDDEPPF